MAIEVRIPKEITEYQEKIIFGMSFRQLLSMAAGLVIGVSSYIFLQGIVGADLASYIVMAEVVPLFAFGFFRKNGFTFERYAMMMLKHQFGVNKRIYKTELDIDEILSGKKRAPEKKKRRVNRNAERKDKEQSQNLRENTISESSTKGRARKRTAAIREIKAARNEYRAAKQTAQKAAQSGSGA
jgi:hypothetical protein